METFKIKKFNLENLKGLSNKNIEEHLKLYAGYVNNSNFILNKIKELESNTENNYIINELRRRFSFEFNGMRNHEYYFTSLSGGKIELSKESLLFKKLDSLDGGFARWLENFKTLAMTRGIGWAILYYDKNNDKLLNQWVDEQHIGHLIGLTPVLCIDMWEHAFVYDYSTSEKNKYIEAFFDNLNWKEIENNFNEAV